MGCVKWECRWGIINRIVCREGRVGNYDLSNLLASCLQCSWLSNLHPFQPTFCMNPNYLWVRVHQNEGKEL